MFTTIKKRADFVRAFSAGKKFVRSSFILQMVKRAEGHIEAPQTTRIGFTVTKKMGNAVIRNRIKRRLREACKEALEKYGVAGHDYVIVSRIKALDCDFEELKKDMNFAFRRIPDVDDAGKKND